MDSRFLPHNTHIENPENFADLDPHLKRLKKQSLVYHSPILHQLPSHERGIFTLSGGRQIGKTTLLKQWMDRLLKHHFRPENMVFITGELIDDQHSLVRVFTDLLREMPTNDLKIILLDEVTYINNWDKGIKYMADSGMLEDTILVITGSDLSIIKEARMRFPGRRGVSSKVDFHLAPLDFFEFVNLDKKIATDEIEVLIDLNQTPPLEAVNLLFTEFENYLVHGGFLTAINDMAQYGHILPATFSTYSDWIRGDVLKRNKQEHYLQEILEAIIKHYGSQITWNSLVDDLSIDHPKTVSDYVNLLVSMDVTYIQSALLEDKLTASPKKAKKVMFNDPFILHATTAWLKSCEDPFKDQVIPLLQDPDWAARLAEAVAVNHYNRYFSTYYIKGKGEVDIAYVDGKSFFPVEIKWTSQIRPKQIRQIAKYKNGIILTKSKQAGEIQGIPTIPLPLQLLRLSAAKREK